MTMGDVAADWIAAPESAWLESLRELAGRSDVRGLEVGSGDGQTASWILEHLLGGSGCMLDCVDSWAEGSEQQARFDLHLARQRGRFSKQVGDPFSWLMRRNLDSVGGEYDVIHLTAGRDPEAVLNELVLCWPLLREGGALICSAEIGVDGSLEHSPKLAFDGFFACRRDWVLLHQGTSWLVQKRSSRVSPPTTNVVASAIHAVPRMDLGADSKDGRTRHGRTRGVLTGATHHYWTTLRLQVMACREAEVDVAVADHGLTTAQREWLRSQQVDVLDPPDGTVAGSSQERAMCEWNLDNAWQKASLCLASPFDDTIWIDADAVPIGGLDAMFDELDTGSWVTRESFITDLDARQLYLRIVDWVEGRIPKNYSQISQLNSGVFAFRREDAWIRRWSELCEEILDDAEAVRLCWLRDQHALVALLCRSDGAGASPRILDNRGWNWPANGWTSDKSQQRKQYPWGAPECLELIRRDHPGVSVVHWLGGPKPWMMG